MRQRFQGGQGLGSEIRGVMRMHAGGGEQHAGMRIRASSIALRVLSSLEPVTIICATPAARGALHDGLAVGVEAVVREVDADVDQFHLRDSKLEDPAFAVADQQPAHDDSTWRINVPREVRAVLRWRSSEDRHGGADAEQERRRDHVDERPAVPFRVHQE